MAEIEKITDGENMGAKKPTYKHGETNGLKITTVDGLTEEQAMAQLVGLEELRKKGLVITLKDGSEMALCGYQTAKDPAGDPIFHFKLKCTEKILLYYLTQHPESVQYLNKAKLWCKMQGYDLRDGGEQLMEMYNMIKQNKSKNFKDGVHPDMDYVTQIGKTKLDGIIEVG